MQFLQNPAYLQQLLNLSEASILLGWQPPPLKLSTQVCNDPSRIQLEMAGAAKAKNKGPPTPFLYGPLSFTVAQTMAAHFHPQKILSLNIWADLMSNLEKDIFLESGICIQFFIVRRLCDCSHRQSGFPVLIWSSYLKDLLNSSTLCSRLPFPSRHLSYASGITSQSS